MAAALAVRRALGDDPEPVALAADLGRGLRSGVGVHGFARGGLLVDGGKGPGTAVRRFFAGMMCRTNGAFCWRRRGTSTGSPAPANATRLRRLARQRVDAAETETLCRLVLLGLLPALVEGDLAAFGEAVFEFNRRAGLLFKTSQGGEYRSPAAAELVAVLRDFGVRGVGQSSWGPTIFAIDEGEQLAVSPGKTTRAFQ